MIITVIFKLRTSSITMMMYRYKQSSKFLPTLLSLLFSVIGMPTTQIPDEKEALDYLVTYGYMKMDHPNASNDYGLIWLWVTLMQVMTGFIWLWITQMQS